MWPFPQLEAQDMNRKAIGAAAAAALAAVALAVAPTFAQDPGEPTLISADGPSAGTTIASGVSSTGAAIGPDGALYVGVGGTAEASDEELTLPADLAELFGLDTVLFGLNSTVMRVDPDDGAVTTYADNLPSVSDAVGGEPFMSPTDVIFVDNTLYVLITGGAPDVGGIAADWPNGIYTPDGDGWDLVADINQFNDDNPVDFPDAGPGGNPFAIDLRGSEFIVSDGNYNRLLRVTMAGDISVFSAFDNVVPTGLAAGGPGPVLNTWFSAAPHFPEDSYLTSIAFPTGAATPLEGSNVYAQLIDVEFGPGGAVYVLQMGDQQLDEAGPPPPGRLLKWSDGSFDVLVTGLFLPTSVNFSGDTAYITSLTGDVLQVEGVSALVPIEEAPAPEPTTAPPPAPAPTTAPPVGPISPPNTGTGDASGVESYTMLVLVLALAGTAAVGVGVLRARG